MRCHGDEFPVGRITNALPSLSEFCRRIRKGWNRLEDKKKNELEEEFQTSFKHEEESADFYHHQTQKYHETRLSQFTQSQLYDKVGKASDRKPGSHFLASLQRTGGRRAVEQSNDTEKRANACGIRDGPKHTRAHPSRIEHSPRIFEFLSV